MFGGLFCKKESEVKRYPQGKVRETTGKYKKLFVRNI